MPRLTPAGAGRRSLLVFAVICAALLALAVVSSRAHAARGLELGFYEPDFASSSAATRTSAFDRAVQAHAGWALIYITWASVAPGNPGPGFQPTHPNDPEYHWDAIDAAVRDASARHLRIVLSITTAPSWAEGPGRPSLADAPPGTWMPNAGDLGDFARAAAERYDGKGNLPAVHFWQLWAEPNLGVNLSPQFVGNTPVGFEVYRPMLSAFYANVKAASPQNQVITGGTAPYGGLTPARGLTYQRMQPLTFWKGLLCEPLTSKKKKKKKRKRAARAAAGCSPPPFDIAAHHAINVGAPTRHATNANDASTPDIGRLRSVLRAAGMGSKPIWNTEIWWNSNPPSRGVSLKTQARYLEQSFYILWKQGVSNIFWFEVRDALQDGVNPIPTCGVFFRDGRPKPSLRAYQFPFVTERLTKTRVRAWGLAPTAGKVKIGTGKGKHFHVVRTLKAGANRVFVGNLRIRGRARLRAKQGSNTSLIWRQS
jgi:hypothetical protein